MANRRVVHARGPVHEPSSSSGTRVQNRANGSPVPSSSLVQDGIEHLRPHPVSVSVRAFVIALTVLKDRLARA